MDIRSDVILPLASRLFWLPVVALVALFLHGGAAFAVSKLIKPGTDEEALAYYSRISGELGFQISDSSLSDLAGYLGYRSLSAGDLEFIEPTGLMPTTAEGFEQLRECVEEP